MKKKSLILLCAVLLILSAAVPASALVGRSESFYVADYANVLSPETEQTIVDLNGELEFYCSGAQLVVVSVDYLDQFHADEYAMTLFNDWGVGSAQENNGMLLLMIPNENKGWLTIGAGLEDDLSDNDIDNLLNRYFWDDFDRGDYDSAVMSLVQVLTEYFAGRYGVSSDMLLPSGQPDSWENEYSYEPAPNSSRTGSLLFIVIVILLIYLVIRWFDRMRYRSYCSAMGLGMRPYHWWYLFMGPHLRWHGTGWYSPGPGPGYGHNPPNHGYHGYGNSWNHGSSSFGGHSSGSHSSGGFSSGSHSSGGFGGGFGGHSGGGFGGGGHGGGGGGRR